MGFNVNKIENSEFYVNKAFKKASNLILKIRNKNKLEYLKDKESRELDTIKDNLNNDIQNIIDQFPNPKTLNPFYKELIDNKIGLEKIHMHLKVLKEIIRKLNVLTQNYKLKFSRTKNINELPGIKTIYLGRVKKIFKKIDKDFIWLDNARRNFKEFPQIKELPTFCLCGYPNVGKSTLLNKLTPASAKVKSYAFTTLKLNLGYLNNDCQKYQIIDTPGFFDRPFEKMNIVEKQAYLAIKHLTKKIFFIIDPTSSCGYSFDEQTQMFKRVKKMFDDKTIIVLINKIDLMNQEMKIDVDSQFKKKIYISAEKGENLDKIKDEIISK